MIKRTMFKKVILKSLLGVFTALFCFVAFLPRAHAEEVKVNITATPTELPDAGTVMFTFEIANYNADYPMTDVEISYNGAAVYAMQDQQIPPSGSVRDIVVSLDISQAQLGKPISFIVTWVRNGEPMYQEASITVQQAENPVIAVTRTASTTNAKPGDNIVLTYTVKNPTKFDMSEITLIDENISDNPILQLDSLKANSSYSIDYTFTMGEESVSSTPFATYTVNGKTKTFSSLDPLELVMVRIQLDMKVDAGTPTQNGVTFTFDIENTGTQTISDITVEDERTNLVNDTPFSLDPGESTTLSYAVVPLMNEPLRNVKFTLNGTDSFGNPYTLAPDDIYEVYPYVDESQISVIVQAETVTPWTSESGKISARVTITNHSTVELTGITVLETSIGVIKNFDSLPAGETSFDLDIQLGSPRNLSISVKGYDPTGTNRELANCVMPVAYGTETAEVETATPAPSGGSMTIFDGLMNGVSRVLVILAVLMVLSFVVLVFLTFMERSKAPRRADEDDELDDYLDDSREPQRTAYSGEPDAEEISYTKRMLAQKDDRPFSEEPAPEPIRLPPPAAVAEPKQAPKEHPEPERNPMPERNETPVYGKKESSPARSAYDRESPARAAYRPAKPQSGRASQPEAPPERTAPQTQAQPTEPQSAVPRVYDYRKQPKRQPVRQQTVTRIAKSKKFYDDEE